MDDFVLTILDTTGIQEYIFGSNKLRENIGASHLVEQASSHFLYDALQETSSIHNLEEDGTITDRALENYHEQQAEVIYRGGGNIVALFRAEDAAKRTVSALSRYLLRVAPGLEITAAHYLLKNAPGIGGQAGAYNQLLSKLNMAKQQRHISTPLLSLGVTLVCRSTGLPAVAFDKEQRAVSAEIKAKDDVLHAANTRLRDFLRRIAENYTFSDDFDDFGRSRGESSYIAVVHADGNAIGDRFKTLVAQFAGTEQNRACINALRALSRAIESTGRAAVGATVSQLVTTLADWEQWPHDSEQYRFIDGLQLKEASGQQKPVLPVRPLVFGGDDVTFVCDGRLGLSLATAYLEAFAHQGKREFDLLQKLFEEQGIELADEHIRKEVLKPPRACAGVAVVKAHYPFRRAYELSDALCTNAKSELRKHQPGVSALDWHFATTGITASLGEMRRRDYTLTTSGDLTMRPVTLDRPGLEEQWRTWRDFSRLIDTFKNEEVWRDRRNKVIALREALRQGSEATRQFRMSYRVQELPELNRNTDIQRTGWGSRCGYFDAIEALDLYLPLRRTSLEDRL